MSALPVRAKTKAELRDGRGEVFPPGTEVEVIEEADAAGEPGLFVQIKIVDSNSGTGVRYTAFVIKQKDLEPIE